MKRNAPAVDGNHLTIFGSELRVMAGLAAAAGRMETGGDLYGLFSRGQKARILLATGPGPKATHEGAHFAQDLAACRAMNEHLEGTYGMQMLGTWHSHHYLGLDAPSGGDLNQVRSLARRNDLTCWCEMVLNLRHASGGGTQGGWWGPATHSRSSGSRVKVNAFHYADPQAGLGSRSAVRVLGGLSPLRLALLMDSAVTNAGIGQQALAFPLDQIAVDPYEPSASAARPSEGLPRGITEQFEELPRRIQENLSVCLEDEMVVVSFPLTDGRRAHVGCARLRPHSIRAVYLQPEGGQAEDVTAEVLDGDPLCRLAWVYRKLRRPRGSRSKHAAVLETYRRDGSKDSDDQPSPPPPSEGGTHPWTGPTD